MGTIDPRLRIGSVTLAVSDLGGSVGFYERALGLPLVERDEHRARLGPDPQRAALELHQIAAPTRLAPGASGLYHVAWLLPSRAALAESVRRVLATGWAFEGAADHGVSEALYLSDPDGLGIELYADRPRECWPRPADGAGVAMVTEPLDIEDLLAQFSGEPRPAVTAETGIGHVHLKVADVQRAAGFYRDALGFEEQARLPSAAFLSAGGYHHHIGLNSWQSAGAGPAPDSVPGLRGVRFELSEAAALDAVERGLAESADAEPFERTADGALSVRDPDGERLVFGLR